MYILIVRTFIGTFLLSRHPQVTTVRVEAINLCENQMLLLTSMVPQVIVSYIHIQGYRAQVCISIIAVIVVVNMFPKDLPLPIVFIKR